MGKRGGVQEAEIDGAHGVHARVEEDAGVGALVRLVRRMLFVVYDAAGKNLDGRESRDADGGLDNCPRPVAGAAFVMRKSRLVPGAYRTIQHPGGTEST